MEKSNAFWFGILIRDQKVHSTMNDSKINKKFSV